MAIIPTISEQESLALALKQLHSSLSPYVVIYCDGACSGNPGPGGWGAIVTYENNNFEFFGGENLTTNNRMELLAAIRSLEVLSRGCQVEIYTDSMYLRDGITQWIKRWKANGWLTAQKQPVKNQDLWERLDALMKLHQVSWHWVRGHGGNLLNERADNLARHGIVQISMQQPKA